MDRLEFAATYELEGDTLTGVVHVFGTRTLRDGLYHSFDPKAFDRSIKAGDPIAFYSHDTSRPLARPSLEVRDGKLHYSMTLGHQSYADDLRENVAHKLMDKMSFGVYPEKWKDSKDASGATVRTHTSAALFDISPVTLPAFTGTSALLHSRGLESRESQLIRARARANGGTR